MTAAPPPSAGPEPDYLDLGPGPRPEADAELLARLRTALLAADPISQSDVEQLLSRLTVDLDGADVDALVLDATGLELELPSLAEAAADPVPPVVASAPDGGDPTDAHPLSDPSVDPASGATPLPGEPDLGDGPLRVPDLPPPPEPPAAPPGARRTPASVRRAVLRARPVHLRGVPVEVEADAADLPFSWVEGGDRCGIEVAAPAPGWRLRGTARASAPTRELVAAVRAAAAEELGRQGVRLTRFEVDLTGSGPRTLRARVRTAVRKGLVSGSVTASGTASVDDALVLQLRDVRLTSRNPILAVALLVLRGKIRAAVGRPVPLAEHLPPWVHLTDLQVGAGPTLTLSLRCG
ncbi:hypothetical protein DT076_08630 [Desertihabitans brevis]|uniref:Uncharacterized protein n=1 Tax=Desertihabitans brevis TaxID=2268447 RepID=A0A367YYL8_9ACTN|nr:hypothetical protein [Desertihabitans brevis]RCK70051.1 hypothetical protein DT076_08630 [Desertihabitans brevis]